METINSPAQSFVSDLRKALMLKRVKHYWGAESMPSTLANLHHIIPLAHVFDLGHLLDPWHKECLPAGKTRELVADTHALIEQEIWFIPFDFTIIFERGKGFPNPKPAMMQDAVYVSLLFLAQDKAIAIHSFMATCGAHTWDWHWMVSGVHKPSSRKPDFAMQGVDMTQREQRSVVEGIFVDVQAALGLLNRKDRAYIAEPAPFVWTEARPPKNYQTPNPSVSIIRVNTNRVLQPPADNDDSGATVRPHDRRSHLRRRGNKLITVRSAKIHGGAPAPTAKVVKLENAL